MAALKGFGLSSKGMMTEKEEISKYKLPICDVDKERRNFGGYMEYEGIDPFPQDTEGTTDTDADTHQNSKEDSLSNRKRKVNRIEAAGGYTQIYGLKSKKTRPQKGR